MLSVHLREMSILKRHKKGCKKRQGPTLSVCFTEMSVLRLIFTSDGVVRSIELNNLVKTAFWFHLWPCCLQSNENKAVRVASSSRRTKAITKRGNVHMIGWIYPLLLVTPTIWFSLDRKWRHRKRSQKEMEMFWFFWLQLCSPWLCLRLQFFIFTRS